MPLRYHNQIEGQRYRFDPDNFYFLSLTNRLLTSMRFQCPFEYFDLLFRLSEALACNINNISYTLTYSQVLLKKLL